MREQQWSIVYDSFNLDCEHGDCREQHQAPVVPRGRLQRTAQPIEDNRFLWLSRPLLRLHVSIQACAILHVVHGSSCGRNGHLDETHSIRTVVSIEEASLLFLSLVSSAIVSWVSSILPGSVVRGRVGGGTGVVVYESKTRHTKRRRVQGSGNAHPRRDTTSNSNVQLRKVSNPRETAVPSCHVLQGCVSLATGFVGGLSRGVEGSSDVKLPMHDARNMSNAP